MSTNNIEKISNLAGLTQLEVLSLGRNCIRKLEGLEPVAGTLKQLWISYNSIEKLVRSCDGSAGLCIAACKHARPYHYRALMEVSACHAPHDSRTHAWSSSMQRRKFDI